MKNIKIEKLVAGGSGLGYIDNQVAFIPYTIPGEEISFEVVRSKQDLVWGIPQKILKAGASRVLPACSMFQECGGCHWQHINYTNQLEYKRMLLEDALVRIGKLRDITLPSCLASPKTYGYRHRVRLHAYNNKLGFYKSGTKKIVPIKNCPILTSPINMAVTEFSCFLKRFSLKIPVEIQFNQGIDKTVAIQVETKRSSLPPKWREKLINAIPFTNLTIKENDSIVTIRGADRLKLAEGNLEVATNDFYQANLSLLPELVKDVVTAVSADTIGVELYAGMGCFSIPLANKLAALTTFERNNQAVDNAKNNFKNHQVNNISAYALSAEEGMELILKEQQNPDVIILDPPREGISSEVCHSILQVTPKQIIYVSCNPATLSRDLKTIMESGKYQIDKISLLDMFPQTFHLETVFSLSDNQLFSS